MKKLFNWQVTLGLALVALSVLVYYVHYLIFRDAHHIFIYLVGDVAFVFIEVLMVTMIIHSLLGMREKRAMLKKLNMVIGIFFSEVGTMLLMEFSDIDPDAGRIREELKAAGGWSDKDFAAVSKRLKGYDYKVRPERPDVERLAAFLAGKRNFLLRLLENPNLLEHDSFTDMLWAAFHLTEELAYREKISEIPDTDLRHIAGDMERVYSQLVKEWLAYMKHLKSDYPYLFSLALRTNPFNPEARAEVA